MTVKLLGYKAMKGTSKKTGRDYSGTSLYFAHQDPQVVGEKTDNCFVSDDITFGLTLNPGQLYELDFNRQGYVVDMRVHQSVKLGGK